MRALLSVYDKTGIVQLGASLERLGWEIVSTGGTLRELQANSVPARSVADITGFPEILEGRVKTLHPLIHGGILGRADLAADRDQMDAYGIEPFGLVAVNLYPFEATISRADVTEDEAIEQIDIGGPAMLRASAKNHRYVLPVCDPGDYEPLIEKLQGSGVDLAYRKALAAKAFGHTSAYDATVAAYFRGDGERFPAQLTLGGSKVADLRYGENPHQRAAAYRSRSVDAGAGIIGARQLGGKDLSFNNLLDADAAWACVLGWDRPAVSIIKHTIPCGLAVAGALDDAYRRALAGDPVSAFGGIVASNRQIDGPTANLIAETFYEVIVAPGFDEEAVQGLARKKQLRLLAVEGADSEAQALDLKRVSGGWLMQDADDRQDDPSGWSAMTSRVPSAEEERDLRFAWRAVRHVKSNAIVLAKGEAIVGVGSGQPNRVESVHIAVRKAGSAAPGSVLASDAFFPFADGVEAAAAAGVTAIVQPGGSMRDADAIAAAERAGIAMLATGRRHFRH